MKHLERVDPDTLNVHRRDGLQGQSLSTNFLIAMLHDLIRRLLKVFEDRYCEVWVRFQIADAADSCITTFVSADRSNVKKCIFQFYRVHGGTKMERGASLDKECKLKVGSPLELANMHYQQVAIRFQERKRTIEANLDTFGELEIAIHEEYRKRC